MVPRSTELGSLVASAGQHFTMLRRAALHDAAGENVGRLVQRWTSSTLSLFGLMQRLSWTMEIVPIPPLPPLYCIGQRLDKQFFALSVDFLQCRIKRWVE